MSSVDGLSNFHAPRVSGQLPTLASFQPNGLLGKMNSSSADGMHGLVPSQTVQLGCSQHQRSYLINDLWKLHGISLLGNRQGNSLQVMPTSLGLDQLQQPRVVQEVNNILPPDLSGSGLANGVFNNSFANMTNNALSVQTNKEQTQAEGSGNYSSARTPSSSSDPFEFCFGALLTFLILLDVMTLGVDKGPKFSDFGSSDKSKQKLEDRKQNHTFNPISNWILSNGIGNKKTDTDVIGQTVFEALGLAQDCSIDKSRANGQLSCKDEDA